MKGIFRRGIAVIAAVTLTAAIAGCSGDGGKEGTGQEKTVERATENTSGKTTENSSDKTTDKSAAGEVKLPEIKVTNPTLRVLTHDGLVTTQAEKLLKSEYGITEIKVDLVPPAEKRTKLMNAVMANDSYDIYWDDFAPGLIMGGYVQTIDVDIQSPLWSPLADSVQQFMWNGQRFYLVPGFARQSMVYYNKSMLDEAGEEYPTDLFDQGKWDWNKLYDMAKALTVDSNKDGTPEQYGLGFDEPEHILYTTGKHFVSFMPDGTAKNNIQSPETARAVAFNVKLLKSGTMVPSNARQSFGEGSVAMCIGHRWYAYGYAKLIKAGDLGLAPLPRDPDADKYYTAEEGGGFYIPKGAPNIEGARAAANVFRFVCSDPSYIKENYMHAIKNRLWTEELQKEYEKSESIEAGVLRNWEAFGLVDYWGDIFTRPVQGEPWETISAELAPKIDASIKELYEAK